MGEERPGDLAVKLAERYALMVRLQSGEPRALTFKGLVAAPSICPFCVPVLAAWLS